ncbi:MAG: hypothetical protein ACK4F9_06985 [Brevinematia bacterium]
MRIKNERDYVIRVIDYKGNIVSQLKPPKDKRAIVRSAINLVRLYERAKKMKFLTKDLLAAMKAYAETLLSTSQILYLLLRQPLIVKTLKEITTKPIEELEEEVVHYGKVRVHEKERCSLCGVHLVFPAYIVFKHKGKEVKRSRPIGIKCLNSTTERLWNLVEEVKVNWQKVEKDTNQRLKQQTSITSSRSSRPVLVLRHPGR